jgi:hypothetical protein
MWFIVIAVIVLGIILIQVLNEIIFNATHKHPLTEAEVMQLANKRRNKDISLYYFFNTAIIEVNKSFKSNLTATGKFYRVNETLYNFPSIAASLLKYKKHEWILVAFEKDKTVELIWLNKGFDKVSASLYLSFEEIAEHARNGKCSTILFFHNHPNSNPRVYNCTQPSETDMKSAKELSNILLKNGVNLKEFICERGSYYEYFSSYADNFMPLDNYIRIIKETNNQSEQGNLQLQRELYRGR